MPNLESGQKGNIEGGEFDPVLWIEFGVAQWSERLVRRTKDPDEKVKRKAEQSWSEENMLKAVKAVSEGRSQRHAAELFHVPRTCLQRRLKIWHLMENHEEERRSDSVQEEQKLQLKSRIFRLAACEFPLTCDNKLHYNAVFPKSHNATPSIPDWDFFKPLKSYYDKEYDMQTHEGDRKITKFSSGKLFNSAWIKAATVSVAQNGFQSTGIYPLNANVVEDHEFLPSTTVNSVLK
ncbi:hypothetical protein ANN_25196 [Periplaneta americana]|uniref:HTH psq-type domain-containing protein n=1 Tax=Periplaneta americana TaxID=6978 RepID=A0ABQ8S0T4_PERAM|nr:hypothetical protein ANN_25196 [Periplaneta americana]